MPSRGLPGNANLEQLKKGAKSFQRAVRAGDVGAAEVVREFHPRLSDVQRGTPALERFTRADAQLVIARQFGFASWPKLKAHLELVARYARSPHTQPIGGALVDEQAIAEEFLRLACVNYGDDDPARWERARELLDANPWLARASIYTAAAVGDVPAARELLAADPTSAARQGGPHAWEPLLYTAYSRVPIAGPGRSAIDVARLLLERGADPNAGYISLRSRIGHNGQVVGPRPRVSGFREASSANERWDHAGVSEPVVSLYPFAREHLAIVEPWFRDPDTRRYLGGPKWPARMLEWGERAVGEEFRGAVQTGAFRYLARAGDLPFGYVDCGTFDSCTEYGGEGPDGRSIIPTVEVPAGSIAFAVDPNARRRGLGREMVKTGRERRDSLAVVRARRRDTRTRSTSEAEVQR